MKHTLGKRSLLLLLFFVPFLTAHELAEFSLTTDKKSPYVKEAVEITFHAHQINHDNVMFFFVTPKKSTDYKIVLLQKETKELAYHDKDTEFHYLLFARKSGKISVDFDFVIKVASDNAVAQVYTGSRDNVKWIETDDTEISIDPLELDVKKLSKNVDLVGDFTLTQKLDKERAKAYEKINIKYFLKGVGFDDFSIDPLGSIEGVDIFTDVIKHANKATKDGYKIQREFNYAIIAPKSFTIPATKIECFSPAKNRYYTLTTKPHTIDVQALPTSELLDKEEYPKQKNYSKESTNFLIYLLIFIAGYISAKINIKIPFIEKNRYKDIQKSSNPKELLYILMHSYADKGLEHYYTPLEDMAYGKKGKKSFAKIKREILQSLQKKKV